VPELAIPFSITGAGSDVSSRDGSWAELLGIKLDIEEERSTSCNPDDMTSYQTGQLMRSSISERYYSGALGLRSKSTGISFWRMG
jgi:hypothetical protein